MFFGKKGYRIKTKIRKHTAIKLVLFSYLVFLGSCSLPTRVGESCDRYCLPSDVDCKPKCYLAPGFF